MSAQKGTPTQVITFSIDQEITSDINGSLLIIDGEQVVFQGDDVTFGGEDVVW